MRRIFGSPCRLPRGAWFGALVASIAGVLAANGRAEGTAAPAMAIDVDTFRIIPRESGPTNYYSVIRQPATPPEKYIHASYEPPFKTAVLGWELPEAKRKSVKEIRWKWRAVALPKDGNECVSGKGDSAAVVYVTWKRGLKWYTLKYVWSAVGPKGKICDSKRNPFVAQDTVIVDTGGPLKEWRSVRIDPDAEYRNHFEKGDTSASVPELQGIGLMTDGDQTKSPSSADYADFSIETR